MKGKKLIWLCVVSLILCFLTSGFFAVDSLKKVIHSDNVETANYIAVSIHEEVASKLTEPRIISGAMAHDLAFLEAINENDSDYISEFLSNVFQHYPFDTVFFVNDSDGKYYTQNGLVTNVYENPLGEWYFSFKKSPEDYFLNKAIDNESSKNITVFSNRKVYGNDGKFLGVCGVGDVVDVYTEIIRHYEITNGISIFFLDSEGNTVVGSGRMDPSDYKLAMSTVSSEQGVKYSAKKYGGCVITQLLDDSLWQLVIVKDESDFSHFSYLITRLVWLFILILLFLAVGIFQIMDYDHKKILQNSKYDKMTGLLIKADFINEVSKILAKKKQSFAFFFIDLDHFKSVNDTFGHSSGDECIISASESIKEVFKGNHLLSRFGGDEFCVFLNNVSKDSVEEKIQKLQQKLRKTYKNENAAVNVSGSIGVVFNNSSKDLSYEEISKEADKALYQAKENGRDCHVFVCID